MGRRLGPQLSQGGKEVDSGLGIMGGLLLWMGQTVDVWISGE